MNFTIPPPFTPQCPPCINDDIACVKWGYAEWMVTSTLCSSAFGAFLAVSAHLIKKHYNKPQRPRIQTNLDENDSIPEIVMQK